MRIDRLTIEVLPCGNVSFERRVYYSGGRAGNRRSTLTRKLSPEAVQELRTVINLLGD